MIDLAVGEDWDIEEGQIVLARSEAVAVVQELVEEGDEVAGLLLFVYFGSKSESDGVDSVFLVLLVEAVAGWL